MSPRIRVTPAVARQCAPYDCEYSIRAQTPFAVLSRGALERDAPGWPDRVARPAEKRSRKAPLRRKLQRIANRVGHDLTRIPANERPLALLPLQLKNVEQVFIRLPVAWNEVAGFTLDRHPPRRKRAGSAHQPQMRIISLHGDARPPWSTAVRPTAAGN